MKEIQNLIMKLIDTGTDFHYHVVDNTYPFVYIRGYKDINGHTPEIRVSVHGKKYYVKNCGVIIENCDLDDVLEVIGKLLYFTE